ncbi:MAG: MarR family transcriptional regulator [Chloroflexi bacterium]|nr:MarR family transcriptional regulator [Chloroflexota bacterium]
MVDVDKMPDYEQVGALASALRSRQFPRLIVFADTVIRYVDSRLQNRASWLEINLVSLLIIRGGALTPSKLAHEMLRSKHSMTRLIDSLEAQGLVIRDRSGSDRRTVQIRVTMSGLDFIQEFLKEIDLFEERVMSRLDGTERKMLMQIEKKLGEIIREETSNGMNAEAPEASAGTDGRGDNRDNLAQPIRVDRPTAVGTGS